MKKFLSFVFVFILIISCLNLTTFAESASEEKEICIYNSNGTKITPLIGEKGHEYDPNGTPTPIIITPDKSFDHFVRVATNYIRDLKPDKPYTISIPKGTYTLKDSIKVYSNTVIDFGGSKMIKDGHYVMLKIGVISEEDSTRWYSGYNCVKNVTAMNGTFDGDNTYYSTEKDDDEASIIKFSHAENIILRNITAQNTKGVHHQLAFAASKNVKLINCSFLNMNVDGITNNCEAVQIDILQSKYFKNAKNYDYTTTKDVWVENCTFKNVNRGIGTHSAIAGHYLGNINFLNNTFIDVEGYAIKAVNYRNSEFANNTITNCGSGIMIANMANRDYTQFLAPANSKDTIYPKSNITIRNNKMTIIDTKYTKSAFGIDVFGITVKNKKDEFGKVYSGDFRVSDVEIKDNNIVSLVEKKNFTGIRLEGVYGSQNSKNSDFVTKNNTIYINTAGKSSKNIYGITIKNGTSICCYSNTIYDKATNYSLKNGFYAISGSNYTLTENKVYNTKNSGMRFSSSSNAFVTNNTVLNTSGQGMFIGANSKNVTVNNNLISNVADDGIAFSIATALSVANNTIKNADGDGIELSSSAKANLIKSNAISAPAKNGINIANTAKVTSAQSNTISNAGKNGILLSDTASADLISKNKINSCKNVGISLTNKSVANIIKGNTITKPQSNAIALTTSANAKKIYSNVINTAGKNAIYLSSSTKADLIRYNTITNAKQYAVYITKKATSTAVSSNNISNSGKTAIFVDTKAKVDNINKNLIDIAKTKYSAVSVTGSANVKKINENIINYKKSKNGKKLKVACSNGIVVNSSASNTKQINLNKIKNCKNSGIAVLAVKSKVAINGNTIKSCKYGMKYIAKKAVLEKNKISKVTGKRLKTVKEKAAATTTTAKKA